MAVFTLPPEMISFYKKNIEYITEHAVDPDKRRYSVEGEASRHYIDIDHYSKEHPFEVMPRKWNDAVKKYSEDTLLAYGIVPWQVHRTFFKLRNAFRDEDIDRILKYSADIGHYVADTHVPLHTTENYNGQLTGQIGIHAFWESRLPELFDGKYDFLVGQAHYIDNILDAAWDAVEDSHNALDTVLKADALLSKEFPEDRKYSYEKKGNRTIKMYSLEYSTAYHNKLNGMVERRMKKAIITLGSIWYTAWVDAGQPDITKLTSHAYNKQVTKEEKIIDRMWRTGKIKGREHLK